MQTGSERTKEDEIGVSRNATWLPISLMVLPIVLFYWLLVRTSMQVPYLDDYGELDLLVNWTHAHGIGEKLRLIFVTQHNEYKLMFENAVVVGHFLVRGKTDPAILGAIGNGFVLAIFAVLYLMWKADTRSGWKSPITFVPVAWFLFQLQYATTLNVMYSLQNVAVLFFALLAIYLAVRPGRANAAGSVIGLMLCISASGNGLLLVPLGAAIFVQRGDRKRLAMWLTGGALMTWLYFIHYNGHSSQAREGGSVAASLVHLSPSYAAAFLGGVAAKTEPGPAIAMGLLLCAAFALTVRDKLWRSSPAIFYTGVFMVGTAIAVSGLRSDFGLTQGLASRYRIYSTLMVIVIYLYLVRKVDPRQLRKPVWAAIGVVFVIGVVGFNLVSDRAGYALLQGRRAGLTDAMRRWEHHEARPVEVDVKGNELIEKHLRDGTYEPNVPALIDAMQAGVYTPPPL